MTSKLKIPRFSRELLIAANLVVFLAIAFGIYVRSEERVDHANTLRQRSLMLADELRQSGDDLTRMVRTYAATGDPFYKQHFQDILDIRDGKKPRPVDYWRPYWDLMLSGGPAPRPDSAQTIPLLELMRQAGFTEAEFAKVAEAKANSDALAQPEIEAMKLVESTGAGTADNRAKALAMLYDSKYHQAKVSVMKPIHDFLALLDQRTFAAVQAAVRQAVAARWAFGAIGVALMLMLWRVYSSLRDTLGGSLDEVHAQIARIGGGDFSFAGDPQHGPKNSVLGWLASTREKLADHARERRLAEAAQGRLAAIVDGSTDAIVGKTLTGIVTSWNAGAERLFGYSAEEMVGQSIYRVVPPDREEEEKRNLSKLAAGERIDSYDTVRRHRDGRSLDVSLAISPIKDAEGRIIGAAKIVRDIDERKRTEAALKLEHARVRRFIDANIVGVVIADAAGAIIEANDYFLNLIGCTRADLEAGRVDWRAITPSEWLPVDERAICELRERGSCAPYEKEYLRPDGSRVPVLLADTTLPGAEEQVAAFVLDLTERQHAESQLARSEERYRSIFQLVPCSVWEEDWSEVIAMVRDLRAAHGIDIQAHLAAHPEWIEAALRAVRILNVNEATLKMFEADSLAELLRSLERVFATPDTLPGFAGELLALAEGRPIFETEMALRTVRGRLIHVLLSMTFPPFESGSGTVLVSLMEITERKKAEEEIREFNAGLEQRVLARTAELEAANKELEAFAYSVSHDLRAPLRSIDGFSRILLEDNAANLDEEGRDCLERVRAATQHMGHLIDGILKLSRIIRDPIQRAEVDLSAMAVSIAGELREAEPNRAVSFEIAPGVRAAGDERLLRVALENLLGNAWKFTSRQEGARIEFAAGVKEGKAECVVRDNGVGFDMAYADKLFGAFQRLHSSSEFPGTGIGLATVKRIIHRHGGRVWAESEPGKGATFHFTLPEENPTA